MFGIDDALLGGILSGVIGAGANIFGANEAGEQSDKAMAEARALREKALQELMGLQSYDLPELGYDPTLLKYIGEATPQLYKSAEILTPETVQDSALGRGAIVDALRKQEELSQEGLDAETKALLFKSQRDAETAARGREQAIIDSLQQRGMGGSSIEAMMRQVAAQEQADRMAQSGIDTTALMAQQKALANLQKAQMGESLRSGDVNLSKSNVDILNQFAQNNSAARQAIERANVDLINQMNQRNVAEQRNVQAANVGSQNQAQLVNKQTAIENALSKQKNIQDLAQMRASAQTAGLGDIYNQGAANAARTREIYSQIGSLPGTIYNTYNQYQQNQATADLNKKALDLQTEQNKALLELQKLYAQRK